MQTLALSCCGHYNNRFPSLLTSSDLIMFLWKTLKRETLQSDALIMAESSLKQTWAQQQLSSGYETIANGLSFTSVFFLGPQTCNNHHTPTAGTEKKNKNQPYFSPGTRIFSFYLIHLFFLFSMMFWSCPLIPLIHAAKTKPQRKFFMTGTNVHLD